MPYLNLFNTSHAYSLISESRNPRAAIVFVHGWLLSRHYWTPVTDHLKGTFRCISYDLRGFGESRQTAAPPSLATVPGQQTGSAYSLEAYARDLGALLEALNVTSVWLVGHSLGGSIALWAAKLFPDRVRGVICVNAGGGVYLPKEFARFRQAGQQIVRWRPPWLASIPMMRFLFARLMVFRPLAISWGAQRLRDLLSAQEAAALGSLMDSTTEAEVHRLPKVVAALNQPVYFIAGARDAVMEEKYVRHLASFHRLFSRPASNVRVISDCGHMAMVEHPAAVADLIESLIEMEQSAAVEPTLPDTSSVA